MEERPSVQDYLDRDSRPVPDVLRWTASADFGLSDIPVERYLSAEWHRCEVSQLWRRVWQFACRTEEVPEVGDHVVYDIVDDSLIVVRTGPDEIRAFHNSCLHRGTRLCDGGGSVKEFRCPFHGFTWRLDGTLKRIPCAGDFPQVEEKGFRLPEAKVATWGGFVFVNMDPDCAPLEDFLGALPSHWLRWPLEDRRKALHIAKVLDCNWKVALEAFIESMHVAETHPQLLPWVGDINTQYDTDAGERHWNRMITPQGVPSPLVTGSVTERQVVESYLRARSASRGGAPGRDLASADSGTLAELDSGRTARQVLAEALRQQLGERSGDNCSRLTDCELLDAIQYFVFPNFCPWAGAKANVVYRFRPYGNDPDRCVAEVMFLAPVPEGAPGPELPPVRWLDRAEDFAAVPELGVLGPVFDQDCRNLTALQRGLKSARKPGVTLSRYQESRIRHFHRTLGEWVS